MVLVYFALSCIFAYLFFTNAQEIYKLFKHITWDYSFVTILLHIPNIALGGLSFHFIAKRFHVYQQFRDWFGMSFVANFLNHLLPYRPGVLLRYFYLRKHYHMRTSDYVYVTLTCFFVILTIGALFTLWGWAFGSKIHEFYIFPIITVMILFIITAIIYALKRAERRNGPPLHDMIQDWIHHLNLIFNRPLNLILCLCAIILLNLITALVFYILFIALNTPIEFNYAIFIAGVLNLALLFPITPGNIGVLETLVGILTSNAFNDFSLGFSVVALYRITQWVPSLVLGMSFSFLLIGRFFPTKADFGDENQTQLNLRGE